MSQFSSLIKGKTVALVGPAEYLMGSNYGKEIDKHDVVVRVNRGIELIEVYENDVGKKSDILYSCLIEKPANAGNINASQLKDNFNVKMVCIFACVILIIVPVITIGNTDAIYGIGLI